MARKVSLIRIIEKSEELIQLDDSRLFFSDNRWLSLAEVFELELSGIVFRFFHLKSNVQFHVERLVETV